MKPKRLEFHGKTNISTKKSLILLVKFVHVHIQMWPTDELFSLPNKQSLGSSRDSNLKIKMNQICFYKKFIIKDWCKNLQIPTQNIIYLPCAFPPREVKRLNSFVRGEKWSNSKRFNALKRIFNVNFKILTVFHGAVHSFIQCPYAFHSISRFSFSLAEYHSESIRRNIMGT